VGTEHDDQVAARLPDARVQSVRHPLRRVLQHRQPKAAPIGCSAEKLDRIVRRAAVGDQQLEFAGEILARHVLDEVRDVLGFVQHRHDERDTSYRPRCVFELRGRAHSGRIS